MKRLAQGISAVALVYLIVAGVTSCDSYTDAPLPGTVTSQEVVGTATISGTVLAVDPAARRVAVACDDGVTRTFHVAQDVGNLEMVKANDRITATVVKTLAMFVSKADMGPGVAAGNSVTKTTGGNEGSVATSEMSEVTARVVAVDQKGRTLRLEDATGEVHDWDVQPDVDLSAVNVGDDIVARYTETISVVVQNGQ
jgi:translation initiation factor IF-1